MLSFLKPSSTLKSINRVARVFQSIVFKSSLEGGVINKEIIATRRERLSIISFLRKAIILLIIIL